MVYRPNHSLAHGLRQAYLAVDIALLFRQQNGDLFTDKQEATRWISWLKNKLKADPNFLKKLELANAFQRTGRQSELSRGQNKEKYEAYLLADQNYFDANVKNYLGPDKLFKTQDEANIYKDAIVKKFDFKQAGVSDDLYFLSKIFFTAHLFDLRRLPHFSKSQLHREVSEQLFGTATPNEIENQLFGKMWARAGDYLAATGDRDMADLLKSDWNAQVFCEQAHDPKKMVLALQIAKTKPEEKLFQAIVSHAQGMAEMRSRFPIDTLPSKKALELRKTLENAPYTASEGYLKILLGAQYVEIPATATEAEARRISKFNVEAFLGPRVKDPDAFYVETLVKAMMEERANRGKIVFYHTTEPETGFLYDVYSELRNQLQIVWGNDVRALRAIDKEFIQLNEEIQKSRSEQAPQEKANVVDFMKKFKGVADSDDVYRTMGLSTNFGLFGSDQQKWADTFNMFYIVKDERVATQPLETDKFFAYIEQYTGIPLHYDQYKKILDRFILTCGSNMPCRNGRLIQIFVDPSVLSDMAYFSVLLGAPVLKDGLTPALDIPITLLRTNPEKLLDYLVGTSGAHVEGVGANLLRPGPLALHDLQARVFLRPDLMLNPKKVTIKSYFRFDLAPDEKIYRDDIKKLVNQNLVSWLKAGAPSDPDAFETETVKLKRLAQLVYQGSTGVDAPQAPPTPVADQFVKLLMSKRGEQAARFFEENYDALKGQTFSIPKDQSGRGGGTSTLVDLYRKLGAHAFAPIFKVAFAKGLFPGNGAAFEVLSLLRLGYYYDFIDMLKTLKNPEAACKLFLTHFLGKGMFFGNDQGMGAMSSSIIKLIKDLDTLENVEEIIGLAKPLFEMLKYESSEKVLRAISQIPASDRKAIIQETLLRIEEPKLSWRQESERERYIEAIMALVYDLKDEGEERKNLIWSVTKQVEDGWENRLYAVYGVKRFDDPNLRMIDKNLTTPPSPEFPRNVKENIDKEAFSAIFTPLIDLFFEYSAVEKQIKNTIKYFEPKYRHKELADDMFFLFSGFDQEMLAGAFKEFEAIASLIWPMIYHAEPKKEYRKLILAVAKKIVKDRRDWKFALKTMERLMQFSPEMLKAFASDEFTSEKIINTPLTKIEWKKDPYVHIPISYRNISAPFNYEEVLRHAHTKPEIYQIEFLESLEGKALVNTFIRKLNEGLVPTSVCRYMASAYNRGKPAAGYNKSLIADCVSELKSAAQ